MEANIAYYCLHKLHKWPHEFLNLDRYERAFIMAAVQIKLEHDKKQAQKAKTAR
ncbi:hypothetical protein [Clostridium sp. E02]|uniref:hypothetical protein n=1 Tax=Clostridium sp. E02 TaxID=2487134 RepID=UPI0013DDCE04|nr:hypothetical protein [Clostridium sp. E02]